VNINRPVVFLAAAMFIVAASFYVVRKIKNRTVPKIELAAIVIKDLNDSLININDYIGKPLILNFWGTWCGPCRQEMPGFEKYRKKYGDKINFVMISDEPLEKIRQFQQENTYRFTYARSQKSFHDVGITSVPFTYFYDAKGKIIFKKKDVLGEDELEGLIMEMIAY